MNNKKGFSLIELIVVIAIMAVVLVGGGAGLYALNNQKIETSAKKVYNVLGSAQTLAMSKGDTYFGIVYNKGDYYACTFYRSATYTLDVVQRHKLSAAVAISFIAGGNTYNIGNGAEPGYHYGFIVAIDRTTGRFTEACEIIRSFSGDSVTVTTNDANTVADLSGLGQLTDIVFQKKNSTIDIAIVPLTGKFYYK